MSTTFKSKIQGKGKAAGGWGGVVDEIRCNFTLQLLTKTKTGVDISSGVISVQRFNFEAALAAAAPTLRFQEGTRARTHLHLHQQHYQHGDKCHK